MAFSLSACGNSAGPANQDAILSEINTTPLIDVMLVLLVMLMLAVPLPQHAVQMELPTASATIPSEQPPPSHRLQIFPDGTLLWDDHPLPSSSLTNRLAALAEQSPQPELHLLPTADTPWDQVAKVLANAQQQGAQNIALPPFSDEQADHPK